MNAGAAFNAKIKAQRAFDRKAEALQLQLDDQKASRLEEERQALHDEELRQSALGAAKADAAADARHNAQLRAVHDALATRHRNESRTHDALLRRRAAQRAVLIGCLNDQHRTELRAADVVDGAHMQSHRAHIAKIVAQHRTADAAATFAAERATAAVAEHMHADRIAQQRANRTAQQQANRTTQQQADRIARQRMERSAAQAHAAQNDTLHAAAAEDARRRDAAAARRKALLAEQQQTLVAARARADQLALLATTQRVRRIGEQQLALAAADRGATVAAEKRDVARAEAVKAARLDVRRAAAVARSIASGTTGTLSCALGWITTSPASIVGPTGAPMWLRGVTVAGVTDALCAADPAAALELGTSGLDVLTNLWGANLVRLPLRVEALDTAGLAALDGLIATFAASGAYTLLALDAASPRVLPDAALASLWQRIAARYADEPAILIEPLAPASPVATNWPAAAWSLIAPIVEVRPATLFIVNARDGAHDLRDFPLRLEDGNAAPGVAYGVRLTSRDAAWLAADGHVFAATYPLFVTAWTDGQTGDEAAWEAIARGLQRDMLSMTAEAWNGPAGLVEPKTFRETRFGLAVRRAMALPQRPAVTPFPYG